MATAISHRGAKALAEHLPARKVLVVDENPHDLLACVDTLTRNGYRVSACSSFTEGARQLEAGFDLIILSQGTADFESRPLLERLIEIDRRVPVVVVTRSVNMGCYLDAMQWGARDYVEKPLSSEQLLRLVGSSLPPPITG
jgi:two-component system C4-dicarboxylate transport response regulator DctD